MRILRNAGMLAFTGCEAETERIWVLRDQGDCDQALEEFIERRNSLENTIDSLRNEKDILILNRYLDRNYRANSRENGQMSSVAFLKKIDALNELIQQASDLNNSSIPTAIGLNRIYPNPFNGALHIGYDLTKEFNISVSIFDASGRRLIDLDKGVRGAGRHQLVWNAVDAPSGTYYVRLGTPEVVQTSKVLLVK